MCGPCVSAQAGGAVLPPLRAQGQELTCRLICRLNKFFTCSVLLSYDLYFGLSSAQLGKEVTLYYPSLEPHLENGRVEGMPRLLINERL